MRENINANGEYDSLSETLKKKKCLEKCIYQLSNMSKFVPCIIGMAMGALSFYIHYQARDEKKNQTSVSCQKPLRIWYFCP